MNKSIATLLTLALLAGAVSANAQKTPVYETIETNQQGEGLRMTLRFDKGEAHNHPLMAVWVETDDGKFVETLFVAESIGKGVFKHADRSSGKWMPGAINRPSALPYWGHKRGKKNSAGYYLPDAQQPEPDAVTGATPKGDFELRFNLSNCPVDRCRVLVEINQSWDWNDHYTNSRSDDPQYRASAQPSVVYAALVDPRVVPDTLQLKPIGRGHEAGTTGDLYTDLNTLTTALQIADKITLIVGM